SPLAKMLGLAKKNPQGVLMIGAHEPSQLMAKALHKEGIEVMLVDTNRENLNQAQALGLKTFYASILSEYALDEIDLANLGRVMALTSNDEVNSLTCINLSEAFGKAEVYQLTPKLSGDNRKRLDLQHLQGRILFSDNLTYDHFVEFVEMGAYIETTLLPKDFDYSNFIEKIGDSRIPLFLIPREGEVSVLTKDNPIIPKAGQKLMSLVKKKEENPPIQVQESADKFINE
ncbi:MAG TPA: NAD-binding protein, partial [Vampirovibrionales bacterium]